MTLFEWLVVGHLVGDFLLQNRWMACHKQKRWAPLLAHAAVYTASVYLLSLMGGGLSPGGLVLVFATHLILDRREFVGFWTRYVTRTDAPWLTVMIDQTWHVVVLAIAATLA